jgi:hypothetical protein
MHTEFDQMIKFELHLIQDKHHSTITQFIYTKKNIYIYIHTQSYTYYYIYHSYNEEHTISIADISRVKLCTYPLLSTLSGHGELLAALKATPDPTQA